MYLVANIDVEICAAKSCKLCTQYCPEANTIQYSEDMGKDRGFKYGSAYVAVDRCKGCAQCVWVCDNMAKNNAIKMIMIDQLPLAAVTDNITYEEKTTVAVLSDPMIVVGNQGGTGVATMPGTRERIIVPGPAGFHPPSAA